MTPSAPCTPDFIDHPWCAVESVQLTGHVATLTWADGLTLDAFALWLAEVTPGLGIETTVRESMIDPGDLPSPDDLLAVDVTENGALAVTWSSHGRIDIHPGWLRHIAEQQHQPAAWLPPLTAWSASTLDELPTLDGSQILDDPSCIETWLSHLVEFGVCRLTNTPTDLDFVGRLVGAVGPLRDTNFGPVWSVIAKPNPDSTANTGLNLGQHTDLPTRETPPGYQFLHCIQNTVEGGWSRLTDGLAVVERLEADHPDAFDALTTLNWVFANRSPDAEHRWVGPIIELPHQGRPLTLRAFYPVRLAPAMSIADQPRAYEALRVFSDVAHDPSLQISTPFTPGDLIGFDNRRILHGRDAFSGGGDRHLRGCYADHDDLLSRLRVLRRPHVSNVHASNLTDPEGPAT